LFCASNCSFYGAGSLVKLTESGQALREITERLGTAHLPARLLARVREWAYHCFFGELWVACGNLLLDGKNMVTRAWPRQLISNGC